MKNETISNNPDESQLGGEQIPESNTIENQPEEKRDRFMELMEKRHRNAMAILKIEEILSREEQSDEYPTNQTPENIRIRKEANEALGLILETLSADGFKKFNIRTAIDRYIFTKVMAQRLELQLKEQLQHEEREANSTEIGTELFKQRTGESPKKPVKAIRCEGYFILVLGNDDYLKFIEGLGAKESIGSFHRAVRFPNMEVDVILSRDDESLNTTILHERQHFINNSVLRNFEDIESYNIPPKQEFPLLQEESNIRSRGLIEIKDELLARIRDGSDSFETTNFFTIGGYKYLSDKFSEDQQKEVNLLLKGIKLELKSALNLFRDTQSRGVLVYHLIDVPLLRFPEKIKAVSEFYSEKIGEFMKFIPDKEEEKQIQDQDRKRRLVDLRLSINGEAHVAADLILGVKNMNYEEVQTELEKIKDKIKKLREDYDNLLAGKSS